MENEINAVKKALEDTINENTALKCELTNVCKEREDLKIQLKEVQEKNTFLFGKTAAYETVIEAIAKNK